VDSLRKGNVEPPREGRVELEPRCPDALPIKPASGFSCPKYNPGLPGTLGIWRFSVTSQTGLFSSEGKGGLAFFSGWITTNCERPGKVPIAARLGRLDCPAKFLLGNDPVPPRLGSVLSVPGIVRLEELSGLSWPTPGRVPLEPVAGAQADGL